MENDAIGYAKTAENRDFHPSHSTSSRAGMLGMEPIEAFGLVDIRAGAIKDCKINSEAKKPAYKTGLTSVNLA